MKLPILPTQEIGSIRKPDYLFDVWKKYFAGKASEEELNKCIKKASIETIKMLEDVGLDIVWDGEMHRWEMYYHPISYIQGIEFVGQVRILDNRYFVKGAVKSIPKLVKNYHLEEYLFIRENARKPVKIPITGPYTIADWSFNEFYIKKWMRFEKDPKIVRYNAKRELVIDIAKNVINPVLKDLSKYEVFRIQIDEPAATTHPNEMDIFVEAFNEAVKDIKATITTHICYSNYDLLLPYIHELKTKQLTLEFANRDSWRRGIDDEARRGYSLLKKLKEYGYDKELGLGVIDVHTNEIEPVELIVDRIKYALKYIEPDKLFINPDCGLRTRAREIARKKLANMVEAVKIVRRELGYGE